MFAHATKNYHQQNSSLMHWLETNPAVAVLLLTLLALSIYFIVRYYRSAPTDN